MLNFGLRGKFETEVCSQTELNLGNPVSNQIIIMHLKLIANVN